MSKIGDIVKEIQEGAIFRDIDESGAEGFWDLAGDYARTVYPNATYESADGIAKETLQEALYNAFYEILETATGRDA